MDRLIYTALTGLQRATEAQGVTANNLANLGTPGFRREIATLSPAWLNAGADGPSARVQSGGAATVDNLMSGQVEQTGRPLDIAIMGGAWLTVQDDAGGTALTRRGDLAFDAEGQLVTGDGHAVMGDDGPIRLASDISSARLARNGTLEVQPVGDSAWVAVGRLQLQSPPREELERGADGLFRAARAAPDPTATVQPGALERSNMMSATALVELVQQSRLFDVQTRLLTAAREMDEGGAALMRVV